METKDNARRITPTRVDHVDVGGVDDDGSSGSNGLRHSSQPSRPTRQLDDPLQSIGGPMTRSRTKKMQ